MAIFELTTKNQLSPYILSLFSSLCLLILSIFPLAFARYSRGFKIVYIESPRELAGKLSRWGKRAESAHLNSFESFIIHAPAILLASLLITKGHQFSEINSSVALLYPLFRFTYLYAYLANLPVIRAFFWGGGLGCSCWIYIECLKAI